jgi:dienelactone hydrolase
MKSVSIWLIIIPLFLLQNSCTNDAKVQEDNVDYLSKDPSSKLGEVTASSIPFQFESGDNKLTGRILLAQNSEPKPTVIFLNGNPGFERNEDIGHALTRNGFNSVFFFYTGSWGNSGVFSFAQCIDDTQTLLTYLKENKRQFKIDTAQIFLIGYSTGADIALLAAHNQKTKLEGIICIDPWSGYTWLKSKNEKLLTHYKESLKMRPAVNIPDGNAFVNEIIENKSNNLQNLKIETLPPTYFIFSSENQKNTFKSTVHDKLIENSKVLNAANHGFSDKRISLTKTINNWLVSRIEK